MKKLFYALVLGSFLSCTVQTTLPSFDLSDASKFGQSHTLSVDSLFSKVEEIRLETKNAPLIGAIAALYESQDAYFVYDTKALHVFGKDGRYIRQVAAKGRGPGEYQTISKLAIDVESGNLLTFDYYGQNFRRYDAEGKFIDAFNTMSQDSVLITSSFFMDHHTPIFYRDNNSLQMDLLTFDWNTKTTMPISTSERKMGEEIIIRSVFPFGSPECPFVYSYFSDTVFVVKNQHIKPSFIIATGRYKVTFEELVASEFLGPRTFMSDIVQGGDYIFVLYGGANLAGERPIPCLGLYNMLSGASYPQIKIWDAQYEYRSLTGNSRLFHGLDPNTLLVVQYPEKMIEAGAQVTEDDNPIIIKYWIKE